MLLETINPATEKMLTSYKTIGNKKITEIIRQVHSDFLEWKNVSIEKRKKLMLNVAQVLRNNKYRYAEILTLEMGKPITQAIAEIEKCAWVVEHYAKNAKTMLAKENIKTDAKESFVQFDPLGIILAVMPWNFPFWQVFRFAAPALMAGNAAVLKHASNVTMSALTIEEIFQKSGLPKNIFRTLLIASGQVKNVIKNPLVKAVTLTGSEYAGSKVAMESGKVLKKTVMELGGSDPFIILEDANLKDASSIAVTARLLNNGQSCIAAKRFIVVEKVYDKFLELFKRKMKAVVIGNPLKNETGLGPIARKDLLLELHSQVIQSVKKGAKILMGGKIIKRKGYYYQATILTNVKKGMPAYEQELFGPVASVIKVKNEKEAIYVANDTPFGLGASLWTENLSKAKELAKQIDSGSVFINGMVKSDPRLPFGGVKLSGFGRELSHYGIKEFVNIKTIWIK